LLQTKIRSPKKHLDTDRFVSKLKAASTLKFLSSRKEGKYVESSIRENEKRRRKDAKKCGLEANQRRKRQKVMGPDGRSM